MTYEVHSSRRNEELHCECMRIVHTLTNEGAGIYIYTYDEYHVRAGYMLLIQLRGMYYTE